MFKVGGFLKDVIEVDHLSFSKQVSLAHRVSKWIASASLTMIPWIVLLFVGFETSSTYPGIFSSLTSLITIVLIVFLEVQNMVGLYMLRIPEILGPLPLSNNHIRLTLTLLYFKLYDKVIISYLASTTIAVMVSTQSLSLAMIQFVISFLTVSYGLGLAMLISKVFYFLLGRLADVRARYFVSSAYALSIALIISLPFYVEIIVELVTRWFFEHFFDNDLLTMVFFPISFYSIFRGGLAGAISVCFSVGYVLLGLLSWVKIYEELAKLSLFSRFSFVDQGVKYQSVGVKFYKQSLTKALLKKYVKTILRFPGYSIVFFLPLTLALISCLAYPGDPVLGVQAVSLGMMIFPPVVLSVEAFGHEYAKTLPLSLRTIFKTLALMGILEYLFTYFFYFVLISVKISRISLEVLNTAFTLLHVPGLIMIELWLLFKLEGDRVFTGSFYMKLSRTIVVYIATYILFFIPVWSSYFYALFFLDKIMLQLIPLAFSAVIFTVAVIFFSRIR